MSSDTKSIIWLAVFILVMVIVLAHRMHNNELLQLTAQSEYSKGFIRGKDVILSRIPTHCLAEMSKLSEIKKDLMDTKFKEVRK